jgi:transposase-like protein
MDPVMLPAPERHGETRDPPTALSRADPAEVRCPRCGSSRVQRWGRRAGRQRRRCSDCKRTFNDLTGTVLARCKRLDHLRAYRDNMPNGLTVRAAARAVGVSPKTSFRWRHRLLDALRAESPPSVGGVVDTAEISFRESRKGERNPDGDEDERGWGYYRPRVWVLVAGDEAGNTVADVIGARPPTVAQLERLLRPERGVVAELISTGGKFSPYARFRVKWSVRGGDARGGRAVQVRPVVKPIADARAGSRRLVGWMKRFRGVATKYLGNYLRWYVAVAETDRSSA